MSQESKFYAVRTIAGREVEVALLIESRARERKLDIRSIIVPPRLRGVVIVEAPAAYVVAEAIRGVRYARSVAPGYMTFEHVSKLLRPEERITLKPGDIVEIIAGVFRGSRARVERVDAAKGEVELTLLDTSSPIRVHLGIESVRPVKTER